MGRTESITIQVHPVDEQGQINLMQKFHWSLLSTQEIKTIDSHLEQRGDSIYSVTKSENYVKLAFQRDLDLPHLKDIKQLEQEYFALPHPVYPKLFPMHILVWLILAVIYGIGIAIWLIYFFTSYKPKKEQADQDYQNLTNRRNQIMTELTKFD